MRASATTSSSRPSPRRSRRARTSSKRAALDAQLAAERVDVTLPVRPSAEGRIHPVSQVTEEIIAIFGEMGFAVAEGPDIEDDFNNFAALNIPAEHPARQMHGHVLPRGRAGRAAAGAAHPHQPGADPHDAGRPAAATG